MNFPPALCLVGSSLSLQENCVQIFLLTSVGNACKHGDHCCCQVTSVMSDSVWPHRQQPTRLPHPWDSQGKNTGVGCHFLLQCMKVKSESEVTQSCLTLSDPMDYSPPGPPSMGFSRQEYWSGVPLPSPYIYFAGPDSKEFACSAGDLSLTPGLGRSPGERNGYSLQYSCLENSMDRGAWWATVHGVTKSRTRLSNYTLKDMYSMHLTSRFKITFKEYYWPNIYNLAAFQLDILE